MSDTTPTDYQHLIDAETWDFIKLTDSHYPPQTIDFSIDQQREVYNTMCRQFYSGTPKGISSADDSISHGDVHVPIRRYQSVQPNSKTQIVYFHGGGFVVGGLDSHDDVCAELCERTGFGVTSVDYRLSPEHKHPAAFEDSLASVTHESNRLQIPVLLCGDSAGGNLAAAVSHAMRSMTLEPGMPAIAGQVLIYPGLGGDMTRGSYVTHAEAPMLSTRDVAFYADVRTVSAPKAPDPTLAPLTDIDFSGLPASIIVSAECDPLSDDGRDYRDAIVNAGGKAAWFNEQGLVHGYLRARHSVSRAKDSFNRIVDGLKMLANGKWYS